MKNIKPAILIILAGWISIFGACKPKATDDRELIPSKENRQDSSIYKIDTSLENSEGSDHMTDDNRNI